MVQLESQIGWNPKICC